MEPWNATSRFRFGSFGGAVDPRIQARPPAIPAEPLPTIGIGTIRPPYNYDTLIGR
jgi:hypothetical protein